MIIYEQDNSPTTWGHWLGLIDGTVVDVSLNTEDRARRLFSMTILVDKDGERYANVFHAVSLRLFRGLEAENWVGARIIDATLENSMITVTFSGYRELKIGG